MAQNSKIEWTDHTWNPWYGCRKVSSGCKNCYMFREQRQYGRDPSVIQRSKSTFRDPLSWAKKARRLAERKRVFTCSWSDFFIEEADPWRAEAWDIIRQTPELIYLILTKRPKLISDRLPEDWGSGWDHVWLGTTVEDQAMGDLRILDLLSVEAKHRFLVFEPLLEYLDPVRKLDPNEWNYDEVDAILDVNDVNEPEQLIEECEEECDWINYGNELVESSKWREWYRWRKWRAQTFAFADGIQWVIAGGESGTEARPCHPNWIRSLRDLCLMLEIPFFFKQWGEYVPLEPAPDMRDKIEVDYLKVGRHKAGAVLDGVEWRQFPEFG